MKITLNYVTTKSGYHQFSAPQVRGLVYFSKAAFTGTPTTVEVEVEGLAAPAATKAVDPAALKAAADKAAAKAAKAQERATKLAEQLAKLSATGTTDEGTQEDVDAAEGDVDAVEQPEPEQPVEQPEPVAEPKASRRGGRR